MKFSIKDFFSICDQIPSFMRFLNPSRTQLTDSLNLLMKLSNVNISYISPYFNVIGVSSFLWSSQGLIYMMTLKQTSAVVHTSGIVHMTRPGNYIIRKILGN